MQNAYRKTPIRRGAVKRSSSSVDVWYARLFRSVWFVIIGVVLLGFISVAVVREGLRRVEIDHEIDKLKSEVARLEGRNTSLHEVIALLSTTNEQIKEARTKLGVASPGEQVIIFSDVPHSDTVVLPDSDTKEYIPIRDYQPNPKKWFHFFWNNYTKAHL